MQSRKSKWVAAAFALVCATLVPNLHQPQAQVRVGTLALNFGLSLMRLIHSDGQLRATAENIMASCIEKARLTPVNGSFWSEADTVAKPAILHLAFHSDSDTKNLCNRLLTQTLKGQPEIAKGLNGAVKAIQQLYGPVQGSVRADPVFRQINGDFLAAMKTSDIAHHWNAPGLAKMEAALVETSGRQMTRDETLVTLGMARRNLFGRAKASASLLSLPALRKSGDIHADDTAKADELVAALWDAKSPTSIRLQSPLRVSAPDGSHTQTSLSGSIQQSGNFAAPAARLMAASPMLERAGLEWAAKTLPGTAPVDSREGQLTHFMTAAANTVNWKTGTNSDKWIELTTQTAILAVKKLLHDQVAALANAPGQTPPELSGLDASLEAGVMELLGLGSKRTIRSSISFQFPFAKQQSGSFSDCLRAAGEGVQAIPNRLACYRVALDHLKEPSIEWVARNIPIISPGLKPLAAGWQKAANEVYGELRGKQKARASGANQRIPELLYRGTAETLKGYYLDLADRMNQDFAPPSRAQPALTVEQRRELGKQVESRVAELWGRKPGAGTLGPRSPEQCFSEAGDDGEKLKKCALDFYAKAAEPLNAWLLQNFPQGGRKTSFLTQAAHETGRQMFDEKGAARDVSLSGADQFKEVPGRILANSSQVGLSELRRRLKKGQNLAQNQQQQTRREDTDLLQACINEAAGKNSRPTVEALVPVSRRADAKAADVGLGLAPVMDQVATTLVSSVESDGVVQRCVATLFGSVVLGVDGVEGKKEFLASWDRVANGRVKTPQGFYERLATPLYQAMQDLKPGSNQSIGDYVKELNQGKLGKKSGEILAPLISEVQRQISCSKFKIGRGPGDPECGCYTKGGFIRTSKGNLFGSELSMVVGLLREASMYDLPGGERVPSQGRSCRVAVGEFMDSVPALASSHPNSDFLGHPMAALADAIDRDQGSSPSLMSCIVVGQIKHRAEPLIRGELALKKLPFSQALNLPELSGHFLSGDVLIGMLNGRDADPALAARIHEISDGISHVFRDTLRTEQGSFSLTLKNAIADSARDLTVLAATSPMVTGPLLRNLKKEGSLLRKTVQVASRARSKVSGQTLTDVQTEQLFKAHAQELDQLGAATLAPVAAWAGGVVRSVLTAPSTTAKMSQAELNECDFAGRDIPANPTHADFKGASQSLSYRCPNWSNHDAGETTLGAESLENALGSLSRVFQFNSPSKEVDNALNAGVELNLQATSTQRGFIVNRLIEAEQAMDHLGTARD